VRFTREGWTTRALQKNLATLFGLHESEVGSAGLKDKHARATQTFSLHILKANEDEVAQQIARNLPATVLWAKRHRNKLKTGHLLGNRFEVIVRDVHADAAARVSAIEAQLRQHGYPNFYGAQRFGVNGENVAAGRDAFFGRGPRAPWQRRFLLSAYQAHLFNQWLARRMQTGRFERLIQGDIAKKLGTGGLFDVADPAVEQPRLDRDEITYTGPIFGARMRWPTGEARTEEQRILDEAGITDECLRRSHLEGTRRPARFPIRDLTVSLHPAGMQFSFALPKGSYATILLREFMKTDVLLPESGESEAD
jgi:tRNA pseudouridine13 synthase